MGFVINKNNKTIIMAQKTKKSLLSHKREQEHIFNEIVPSKMFDVYYLSAS